MSYLIYFTATLLFNMAILSIYVMQVFTEHHHCATRSGRNITEKFEFAFQIGFSILVIDVINTNLINIYLRFMTHTNQSKTVDTNEVCALSLFVVSNTFEWILRFFTITVSLLQFLLNQSNQGIYCVKQPDGMLAKESKCITILVVL